ncbi:DUF5689 domain-containing protein [Aquimarina sp. AU474]|uniref:DUF5689 domain-containing protein n=1 Tax=Aquimarina sp. AU474 TaxID=2108529 RepID=UPI000D69CADA|nr:DUF5689 domain-containing protein [Aquimarina sp. AU474]
MITTQFEKLMMYIVLMLFLSNCTPENDFETPALIIEEQPITGTIIDIEAVLGFLQQEIEKEGENANLIFKNTDNIISGYVVSSDRASNFFKEIIIQNKSANPTAGIRILIDDSPLFTSYEFGRKIFINLNGLSLGIENGIPTLGVLEGNNIAHIPSFSVKDIITRSNEITSITPLETTLENFTDRLLNLYIKLNNIQFNKNIVLDENTFTFAAEPNDKFDGERIVESCKNGRTTILSTSTFSDFKGLKLPENQGSFEGILTKSFLGDAYNIVLNNPNGLVFDINNRCDPEVLNCVLDQEGNTLLFQQDFTEFKSSDLGKLGWINTNTTKGKLKYKIGEFNENKYAQITGFRSKEGLYEVWLITPEIDMSTSTSEVLNFDLQAGYDNGNILEVFVTNNFVDDISSATWIKLDVAIPRGPLNSFGDFIPAGPTSLSCIDNNIRIGFRYTGGDPRATTRYHIDNITLVAQ